MTTIEAIRDDFAFLDDWEDRYRYVIDLGVAGSPIWGHWAPACP